MTSPLRLAASATLLALAAWGCAGLADEAETGLASQAHVRADRVEERVGTPMLEPPKEIESGFAETIAAGEVASPSEAIDRDPHCAAAITAPVRWQEGASCETYRAEITAWTDWCVERCDPNGTDLVAAEAAKASCSEWCAERDCPTATFIPPTDGCATYNCYADDFNCPAERCFLREYCSLLDERRVWNCYCRDLSAS